MSESKPIKNIVNFIVDNPLKTLIIGLVAVLAMSFGASKLYTNFSYRIWFDQNNPNLVEFDNFERRFGSDEVAAIIVHSPSGVFDLESAELLTKLTEDMWQVPEVIRVDSLTNYNWVHAEGDDILVEPLVPDDQELTSEILNERKQVAITNPNIEGYLVNKDATVALIFANLKPAINGTPDYRKVTEAIRATIDKYNAKGDHTIYLTGNPILNFAFEEATQADMQTLVPFVLLMTILFLIFSFRRASGVVLPLLIIALTIATTMGFAGWAGVEMNNLTAMVPQYMIAISIAVAVHVLVNFFIYFSQGYEKKEAIRLSLTKNFRPTLLTAVSTAIGFFSFSSSSMPPIGQMGFLSGFGALFSWIVSYLFLAPFILLIPLKKKVTAKKQTSTDFASPFAERYSNALYKWRKPIVIGSTLFTLGAFYLGTQAIVNSDPFEYFDKSYPMSIANYFVENNVGGALAKEIVVDSGEPEGIKDPEFLKKVEAFQAWVDEYPFITKTVSIVNILKEMNKSLYGGTDDQYKLPGTRDEVAQQLFLYTMNLPQGMDLNNRVTLDNSSLRISAMTTLHESKRVMEVIEEIEVKAKEMGLNAHVTGKFPLYQSNNDEVVDSFFVSVTAAMILVGLLLCFGLQSFKLGLISLIPNTVPLIIGGGFLQLMGIYLDIGTVIVGSICLGIAVDDTIHFLANFRKFLGQGHSPKAAVARVLTHTAPALITTTMVLVAAFATFAFATFVPNQNFGVLVAFILSTALIADLTFLPALLMSLNIWESEQGKTQGDNIYRYGADNTQRRPEATTP